MPWIIIGLSRARLAMAHRYVAVFRQSAGLVVFDTAGLKVLLAFSVLLYFVVAVSKMRRERLRLCGRRHPRGVLPCAADCVAGENDVLFVLVFDSMK